jgi:large subunit ribosomal protein L22
MSVQAIAKSVRISHRKVAPVATLVRGRTVADALIILENVNRRSALPVSKVIKSAQANADYNHNYKPDSLSIVEISVTPGPSVKRFRPIARGRVNPYLHRSSHIRVVVDGEKRQPKKPVTEKSTKPRGKK